MKVEIWDVQKFHRKKASNGLSFLELSGEGSPNPVSKLEGDEYLGGKERRELEKKVNSGLEREREEKFKREKRFLHSV